MNGVLVVLCTTLLFAQLASAQTLASLITTKSDSLKSVVNKAESLQFNRCGILQGCAGQTASCSIPACGNVFDSAKGFSCNANFGLDSAMCGSGCPGMTRSLQQSVVRLAPETDMSTKNSDLAAFICMTKSIETEFKEIHDAGKLKAWQYIGSTTGGIRIYPGAPQGRDSGKCSKYDPRIRPWYVAASSGPKDVVLVLDTSGSMNQYNGNSIESRMSAMQKAVNALLDTMTYNDFISIIEFGTDARHVPSTETSLVQGRKSNLETLKKNVNFLYPTGHTYMEKGFEKAFDVLNSATERTSKCSRIIIFLTDGNATAPEKVLPTIEAGQKKLADAGKDKARIFTYSMGSDADDAIPQKIACANDGVWAKIQDGEDPLKEMSQYYQFLAAGLDSRTVRWTVPYIDSFGMGEMVTGALAVYDRSKSIPLLVGVVGTDVTTAELQQYADADAVLTELINRGATCNKVSTTPCQMQHLRQDTGFVCPSDSDHGTHPTIATCDANNEIVTIKKCPDIASANGVNSVLCEPVSSITGTAFSPKSTAEVTCCPGTATCGSGTVPTTPPNGPGGVPPTSSAATTSLAMFMAVVLGVMLF